MATLGRAFIEVHADTSPFARELRQQMRRLATDLREDTDRAGRLIGQRMGLRARDGLREAFGRRDLQLDADIELSPTSVARTEAALGVVTRDRRVNVTVNRRGFLRSAGRVLTETGRLVGLFTLNLIRIFGDLFDFGRQIGQIFGESFRNLSANFQATGRAASSMASSLVGLAAAASALSAVIILLSGVLGVLLALLVPIVNTVQLLLTLLPGLAVGLVVGLAPLVLVFTNLGDAIKATTGELDEFQEEIEDFGASTRGVLTGLRELVQFFLGIRQEVQEAFFGPINEAINNLNNNLGPTFREGFVLVAEAAGNFAAAFIELFNHPQAIPFFTALFELAELGFEEIGDAVIELVGAFANLINVTIPDLRELVEDIAGTIQGWADSINEIAEDPDLQETIDGWKESFEDIKELVDEILETVGNLIEGFEERAGPILETITGQFEELNDFLESESGERFFEGLEGASLALLFTLEAIVRVLIFMVTLFGGIRQLIGERGILGAILRITTPLGFIEALSIDWSGVLQRIRGWWDDIVEGIRRFVEILSGRGLPFTRTLRAIVRGIATFAGRIRSAFSSALTFARRLRSPLRTIRGITSTIASFARTFRGALSGAAFWAGRIRDAINSISIPSSPGGVIGAALAGALSRFFQEGGIVTRPTRAIIGEAGPEVVIPLTRPDRARELLAISGLSNLIRGGDGATAGGIPTRAPVVRLEFISDGTAAGDAVIELLQRGVRIRGGDVQEVLGV